MFSYALLTFCIDQILPSPAYADDTTQAPPPVDSNLSLPEEVRFTARDSGMEWATTDNVGRFVQEDIRRVDESCDEDSTDEPAWVRVGATSEEEDFSTGLNTETCVSSKKSSIERYLIRDRLYSTSLALSKAGGIQLSYRLPSDVSGVAGVTWCYRGLTTPTVDITSIDMPGEVSELARVDECPAGFVKGAASSQTVTVTGLESTGVAYRVVIKMDNGDYIVGRGARSVSDGRSILSRTGGPSDSANPDPTSREKLTAGIDQGSILVGLTDYMLERADAELRAWMADQQINTVCKEKAAQGKLPGPGDFLENTCQSLNLYGADLLFAGASALREPAQEDMQAFLRNLGEAYVVYDNGQAASIDASGLRRHDFEASLAVLGRTLELTVQGERFEDALGGFAADGGWVKEFKKNNPGNDERLGKDYPVTTTLYLTSAVLASLPRENDQIALPLEDRDAMLAMLPYLQAAIEYNLETAKMAGAVNAVLGTEKSAVIEAVSRAMLTSQGFADINKQYTELKTASDTLKTTTEADEIAAQREKMLKAYAKIASTGIGMAATAAEAIASTSEGDQKGKWQKRAELLQGTQKVSGQLAAAQYGLAIATAAELLVAHGQGKVEENNVEASVGDALVLKKVQWALDDLSFAVALAQADSADMAHDVIEAWAAPVGSYHRKHNGGGFYMGLNGYVGIGVGGETLLDPADEKWFTGGTFQYAPTMLVGVDAGGRNRRGHYWGGFVSLLDLGAVATMRVGESEITTDEGTEATIDYTSKLKFQQVFSPGLYFVASPWRAPFAVGVGANVVPSLREITPEGELDIRVVPAARASLILALDLPLNP